MEAQTRKASHGMYVSPTVNDMDSSASLRRLMRIRSRGADSVEKYVLGLIAELSQNPILERFGLSLDGPLRSPLSCVTFDRRTEEEEVQLREHFRLGVESEGGTNFRSIGRPDARPSDAERQARPESLDEAAAGLRRGIILGDPGSGKTEWLKAVAIKSARSTIEGLRDGTITCDRWPAVIWLSLPEIAAAQTDNPDGIRDLLRVLGHPPRPIDSYGRSLATVLWTARYIARNNHSLPDWALRYTWQAWMRKDLCPELAGILCLDAWDEVEELEKPELLKLIRDLDHHLPARLLMTSRVFGYQRGLLAIPESEYTQRSQGMRELAVCSFRPAQSEGFFSSFFREDPETANRLIGELRQQRSLASMVRNPLMATLIAIACVAGRRFVSNVTPATAALPMHRGEVYRLVLDGLLGEWNAVWKGAVMTDPEIVRQKTSLLSALAFHFFPVDALDAAKVERFARAYLETGKSNQSRRSREEAAKPIARYLLEEGVLLRAPDGRSYQFLHRTFQEYLAARHLLSVVNSAGGIQAFIVREQGARIPVTHFVDSIAWLPAWREVIILTAAELEAPLSFLEALLRGGDDIFHHRLCLVAACLAEFSPQRRAPVQLLADQVANQIWTIWLGSYERLAGFADPQALALAAMISPSLIARIEVKFRTEAAGKTGLVKKWIAALTGGEMEVGARPLLEAARDIGGPAAHTGILRHVIGLFDDEECRFEAVNAFAKIAPAGMEPECMKLLLDRLESWSSTSDVVFSALNAFQGGIAPDVLLNTISAWLTHGPAPLRRGAEWAIVELGPAACGPQVLEALAHNAREGDAETKAEALFCIGKLGPDAAQPNILSLIGRGLRERHERVRHCALRALEAWGSDTDRPTLHPEIDQLWAYFDSTSRWMAGWALKLIGDKGASRMKLLEAAIHLLDDDEDVYPGPPPTRQRVATVEEIAQFLKWFVAIFRDPLNPIQWQTTVFVGSWEVSATPEIGFCGRKLAALWVLECLGTAAARPAFLDALALLFADADSSLQWTLAHAIVAIGPVEHPGIFSEIAAVLEGGDRDRKHAAIHAIRGCAFDGGKGAAIVSAIERMLASSDSLSRWAALHAAREVGKSAATRIVLGGIARALEDIERLGGVPEVLLHDLRETFRAFGADANQPEFLQDLIRILRREQSLRARRYTGSITAEMLGTILSVRGDQGLLAEVDQLIINGSVPGLSLARHLGSKAARPPILDRLARWLANRSNRYKALPICRRLNSYRFFTDEKTGKGHYETLENLSRFT
jgi:hypothetical protein